MNNIFLPNDPLLYNTPNTQFMQQDLQQKMEQKYNEYMMRTMQNIPDKLSELDNKLKALSPQIVEMLSENSEYLELKDILQVTIQNELMMLIKTKINTNQEAIKNIDKQLSIIKTIETKVNDDERKNLSELNDYLKNYSNMTFDEYKKLKNSNSENTRV
jgi:gas vesicle protein